jgi:hypothetical protein
MAGFALRSTRPTISTISAEPGSPPGCKFLAFAVGAGRFDGLDRRDVLAPQSGAGEPQRHEGFAIGIRRSPDPGQKMPKSALLAALIKGGPSS